MARAYKRAIMALPLRLKTVNVNRELRPIVVPNDGIALKSPLRIPHRAGSIHCIRRVYIDLQLRNGSVSCGNSNIPTHTRPLQKRLASRMRFEEMSKREVVFEGRSYHFHIELSQW